MEGSCRAVKSHSGPPVDQPPFFRYKSMKGASSPTSRIPTWDRGPVQHPKPRCLVPRSVCFSSRQDGCLDEALLQPSRPAALKHKEKCFHTLSWPKARKNLCQGSPSCPLPLDLRVPVTSIRAKLPVLGLCIASPAMAQMFSSCKALCIPPPAWQETNLCGGRWPPWGLVNGQVLSNSTCPSIPDSQPCRASVFKGNTNINYHTKTCITLTASVFIKYQGVKQ